MGRSDDFLSLAGGDKGLRIPIEIVFSVFNLKKNQEVIFL